MGPEGRRRLRKRVRGGAARFDADLELVDVPTRELVRSQLVALVDRAARLGAPSPADVEVRIG